MAKTTRRDIELDPRFPVPPAIIDVRQENQEDTYQNYIGDGSGGSTIIVRPEDGPVLTNPGSSVPNAPSRFNIISQTVRTAPDGRAVVDVLIEFPDTGTNVDVKVTPA